MLLAPQSDLPPERYAETIPTSASASQPFLLSNALERYATALSAIKAVENAGDLSDFQFLEVLLARDQVRVALSQTTQFSPEIIAQLIELDESLKEQKNSFTNLMSKLSDWRDSYHPPQEAWWWFFEVPKKTDIWERFDPVCDVMTAICLTAFVSFLTTLTPRFAVGGLDILNSFGIVGSGAVASLVLGSITQSGKQTLQKIFTRFNLDPRYASEMSFVVSFLLLLGAIGVNASLPQIANYYYKQGDKSFNKSELKKAENELKQALALDPEKLEARFLLGRIYEYQENYESARSEYKLALPANLPDAYNNLGRLYIEDGKPFLAETYIVKGLGLAKKANDSTKTYTLLKNLGWAQMEQKRYNEAEKNLKKALAININNRYEDARCVLAEVLARQGNQKAAIAEAKTCIEKGYFANASDYRWYILAKKHQEAANADNSKNSQQN
jgi:tetratricopeptide (TPR) repeat protein